MTKEPTAAAPGRRSRAADLGIHIGVLPAGLRNAITDVPGVRVGHVTLVSGDGPLRRGEGPVRTGVTVVIPRDGIGEYAVFAGCHRLNGNGELTGLEWIREAGMLTTPIAITNTHSVGVVRDALIAADVERRRGGEVFWSLPVVGETYDGLLSDLDGFHVRPEHVFEALSNAAAGAVQEGNVGGGTGMICHEFKGGIGTASRLVTARGSDDGTHNGHGFAVGALVQANYGSRHRLTVDGVPVGREIPTTDVPSPWDLPANAGAGSIIVLVATDAPLLPHQCERLAQRAGLGIARVGGVAAHSSGDLFLAFATGNDDLRMEGGGDATAGEAASVRMISDSVLTRLFEACVDAVEEAIVNALLAAETMTGRDGITAYALPHDRLLEVMARYGRSVGVRQEDAG
jgi:D-aminopeptidase